MEDEYFKATVFYPNVSNNTVRIRRINTYV